MAPRSRAHLTSGRFPNPQVKEAHNPSVTRCHHGGLWSGDQCIVGVIGVETLRVISQGEKEMREVALTTPRKKPRPRSPLMLPAPTCDISAHAPTWAKCRAWASGWDLVPTRGLLRKEPALGGFGPAANGRRRLTEEYYWNSDREAIAWGDASALLLLGHPHHPIVVIDIDQIAAKPAVVATVCAVLGITPGDLVEVATGREGGGCHLYFRAVPGVGRYRRAMQQTAGGIPQAVDYIGHGQVICPGSRHKTGRTYRMTHRGQTVSSLAEIYGHLPRMSPEHWDQIIGSEFQLPALGESRSSGPGGCYLSIQGESEAWQTLDRFLGSATSRNTSYDISPDGSIRRGRSSAGRTVSRMDDGVGIRVKDWTSDLTYFLNCPDRPDRKTQSATALSDAGLAGDALTLTFRYSREMVSGQASEAMIRTAAHLRRRMEEGASYVPPVSQDPEPHAIFDADDVLYLREKSALSAAQIWEMTRDAGLTCERQVPLLTAIQGPQGGKFLHAMADCRSWSCPACGRANLVAMRAAIHAHLQHHGPQATATTEDHVLVEDHSPQAMDRQRRVDHDLGSSGVCVYGVTAEDYASASDSMQKWAKTHGPKASWLAVQADPERTIILAYSASTAILPPEIRKSQILFPTAKNQRVQIWQDHLHEITAGVLAMVDLDAWRAAWAASGKTLRIRPLVGPSAMLTVIHDLMDFLIGKNRNGKPTADRIRANPDYAKKTIATKDLAAYEKSVSDLLQDSITAQNLHNSARAKDGWLPLRTVDHLLTLIDSGDVRMISTKVKMKGDILTL